MASDGGIGCRSHGGTHVVGVPDAKVCNRADGAGSDPGAFALAANKCGSGTGDGPLGCGSALPAVTQGKTVLPLRGSKVRGGHGHHLIRKSTAHGHRCKQQTFRHGGAGTVKSQMGNSGISQGEGGADALIQQIPGEYQIHFLWSQLRFLQKLSQRLLLHMFFGLLPGFLAKIGIPAFEVKGIGKGAFRLPLSRHTGPMRDDRRIAEGKTLSASFVICHFGTILSVFR